MNNNYKTNNRYRNDLYINFLSGNLKYDEDSSSSDSEFSDSYDRRLDDDFNRMISDIKKKKQAQEGQSTEEPGSEVMETNQLNENDSGIMELSAINVQVEVETDTQGTMQNDVNMIAKSPFVPKRLVFSESSDSAERTSVNGRESLIVQDELSDTSQPHENLVQMDQSFVVNSEIQESSELPTDSRNEIVATAEQQRRLTYVLEASVAHLTSGIEDVNNSAYVVSPSSSALHSTARQSSLPLEFEWEGSEDDSNNWTDCESDVTSNATFTKN